jgi:thiol-disulfide isomerase/thioredoxin
MNLKIIVVAALAVASGALASYYLGTLGDSDAQPPAVALDQLVLQDLDGREQEFSQWQGKVLLVNFWATWCPPCIEEIPMFIGLREKYAAAGFEIAGIAVDDIAKAKKFGETQNVNFPLLYGQAQGMSLMKKLGNSMGGLPYSVLYDRNGQIRATKSGAFSHEELEELIKNNL